jgi:hypothetical protein
MNDLTKIGATMGRCNFHLARYECPYLRMRDGFGFFASNAAALMICPDWQYPHCGTCSLSHAFCTG